MSTNRGNIKRVAAVLVLILTLAVSTALAGGRDLQTPPADPDEAERLRIWIPATKNTRCRMTIEIRDGRNQPVRELVNELISPGYYNYYWDKKDDSGQWADTGRYLAVADICGDKRYSDVYVEYVPGERAIQTEAVGGENRDTLVYRVATDSTPVRIGIYDLGGKAMAEAVVDTMLPAGEYRLSLQPEWVVPKVETRYEIRLLVREYVHYDTLWYRP
ncbi:hypothetical protein GF356_00830 [candidate division GN15 bacterium]|nr:hypothetical protein [candidate division GN15 bacterium]